MTLALGGGHRRGASLILVVATVAVELLAISLIYRHGFDFECRAAAPAAFCAALSGAVPRAIATAAALTLILVARPLVRAALAEGLRAAPPPVWALVNGAGFLMILAPAGFLADGAAPARLGLATALWLGGAALAGIGALLSAVAPAAWRRATATAPATLGAALAVALATPEIAEVVQTLWRWAPITEATFHSTEALLRLLGQDVVSAPERVELAVGDFIVLVGRQCSGVEGVALITAFLSFYLALFRRELRFPHALALLPVAIAASWTLNVVRIAVLVMIGAHVSPTLAVNGFHSHAGWLMFTLLAVGLTFAAHALPMFKRRRPAAAVERRPPPLREDWNAARLLPFIAFMATALAASAFFETPTLAYPFRALVMAGALLLFLPLYRALDWRLDAPGLAVGVVVGAVWVATAPAPSAEDAVLEAALAALPAWFFAIWAASRLIGAVLLVPLIEELLFRDYLLRRLNFGGAAGLAVAVAVSTALFAALHDRWLVGAAAGLAFAAVALGRGGLTGAVQSHMAANAVVAGAAVLSGRWSLM